MAENIIKTEYSELMQKSYIDYSMSVITARALPDVRDGLKPVQRRVLYAMDQLGLNYDKPHRKSARIVGDAMGKYHPHGDSSIYETLVVLSQDFKKGMALVDGHGNFGSIEGDGAAAMRYTEAKLKKFSDSIKSIEGINIIEREFVNSDLDGCSFCIAATDDAKFNAYVAGVCRKYHIFINAVDDKDNCDFLFPSVYKAGDLSIGISTQGASPYVAADIKNRIAQELPADIEDILMYLGSIRDSIKENVDDASMRADIFKEAARKCMVLGRELDKDELQDVINKVSERITGKDNTNAETKADGKYSYSKGKVVIAGAGCGTYDLITVRALNAIKKAQVLVYDDLIDNRLMEFCVESCEKIYVGKRNGRHSMAQEEINELLLKKANEGKLVVRLKGGDPYVFGRGGEEMLYLKSNGIETEEIPGVTSAIAVPAMAGIPVTHRDVSRSFSVVTGHTKDMDSLYEEIRNSASMNGTCVYLMGLTHLAQITEALVSGGKPKNTPAAVITGGFDDTYRIVKGTLADIELKAREAGITSPAVIVTGEAVNIDLK